MNDSPSSQKAGPVAEALRVQLSRGPTVERFPDGSVPVYATGIEQRLKLFPARQSPCWLASNRGEALTNR